LCNSFFFLTTKKRLIVIIYKNEGYTREFLANLIKENFNYVKLNDIRIASKHIEIDIFSTNIEKVKEDFSKFFKIKEIRILEERLSENAFKFAKDLFNEERFWEVHEVLENIWRNAKGDDKKILHGIILLAAAFVHYQKGRKEISLSILKRAYDELNNYNQNYNGFDLKYINKKIKEMIEKKEIEFFKLI